MNPHIQPTKTHLKLLTALAATTLALLAGCATNPSAPAIPANNFTGNWGALGNPNSTTPSTPPTPIADFTGALQFTNGSVTGILRALAPTQSSACPSIATDLPATGTLDAVNNLTLTVPLSGGAATLTATLPQDAHAFISGSYQIVGGTCPMPATPMKISQYVLATGTYTGTLSVDGLTNPVPGTATAVTIVLTQSSIPNADGQFPITGAITATGTCAAIATVTNAVIAGGGIIQTPLAQGPPPSALLVATIDPTADTMIGSIIFSTCNPQDYEGTLTRR